MGFLSPDKKVISSIETARILGISVSSVKNWVRHGFIESISSGADYAFLMKDVFTLQSRIEKGDLKRLSSRANKINSFKTFLPDELVGSESSGKSVSYLSSFIIESGIDNNRAMFMIALNLLKKDGFLEGISLCDILEGDIKNIKGRVNLSSIISEWKYSLMRHNLDDVSLEILEYDLPDDENIAGVIYQSILLEGDKSRFGSYYTPDFIVDNITERLAKKDMIFLDPCCGTGQFLLAFAGKTDDPKNIYGIDVDPLAVNVARINIIRKYRDIDFYPNIYCKDSLIDLDEYALFTQKNMFPEFDIIATNPPWGFHYGKGEQRMLEISYDSILSGESFSYFIIRSLKMLKENGRLCFVLPESFLNVKIHSDIRKYVLDNCAIERIEWGKRIFKNVFTSVCIVDLKKTKDNEIQNIQVINESSDYLIKQKRFKNNKDFNFDIHICSRDEDLLNRIYRLSSGTLKENALWALGIVTGNNSAFLSKEPGEGLEPVITGKEISPFKISDPAMFIRFEQEKFQQCAPEHIYRSKEKLVYRFISKKLIFACDTSGCLTLNSANVVIPGKGVPPAKALMALFNSDLYQFIFQKKFSSVKVLKSHIEELPIPGLTEEEILKLNFLSDSAAKEEMLDNLNIYVFKLFNISGKDIDYIQKEIR